jgi:two-component system OmpR family response regulator
MGEKSLPGARVLVVEDDADLREYIAGLMRAQGHTVEVADNGLKASFKAGSFHPDVVLLDLNLPAADGRRIGKVLRERLPGVAICVVSGSEDIAQVAQEIGASYVPKPFNDKTLIATVNHLLRRPA